MELLREGNSAVSLVGETRNLSTVGVLFTSSTLLPVGQPIEYAITLPTGSVDGVTVRLHCLGKVVRTEPLEEGNPPRIAATLERYEFVRR
jgi:hypothetical protein